MTTHQAKKDAAARLTAHGVTFTRLTARTVSFAGFGFGSSIFVAIHGGVIPASFDKKKVLEGVPKPSEGGYCLEAEGCTRPDGTPLSFGI